MSLSLVDTGPVPLYVSNPGYKLKNNTTGKSITTRTEATQNGNFTIIEKGPLADTYRKAGIVDGGISGGLPGGDRVVYTYNAQNNTYTFNTKDGFRLSDYSGSSLDNVNRNIKTSLYTTIPPNSALALSKLPGYQSVANSNQPRSPIVDPNVAEALEQATGVEQTPADQEGGDGSSSGGSSGGDGKSTVDLTQLSKIKSGYARESYGDDIRYPSTLNNNLNNKQDVIKFTMYEYNPTLSFTGTGDQSTFSLNRGGQTGTGTGAKRGSVVLPIQPTITDTNSVSWQQDSLNPLELAAIDASTGFIEDGVGGLDNAIKKLTGSLGSEGENLATSLKAGALSLALGKNLLARTTGAILNPNVELLFNAPSLRTFSYSFKLSARNDGDSRAIQQIIRFFKQGMSVQRSPAELFLVTPDIFQIQYLFKEGNHPYINRIKTCALTSCSVDYTPTGSYMTFTDGAMVSYTLNLTFEELEPVYHDDYKTIPEDEIGY